MGDLRTEFIEGAVWHGTLEKAETLLARQPDLAKRDWAALVDSFTSTNDRGSAALGLSAAPPFYRVDWKENCIELKPPLSDRDWDTIFAVMKERGIANLRASGLVTDAALSRLTQLDLSTGIDFGGSKRLTDHGLRHLARMPQLRELDLSAYPGGEIGDRGLEVLRHLPELRKFNMCWQRGVSDAGVANLSFCDRIESTC